MDQTDPLFNAENTAHDHIWIVDDDKLDFIRKTIHFDDRKLLVETASSRDAMTH